MSIVSFVGLEGAPLIGSAGSGERRALGEEQRGGSNGRYAAVVLALVGIAVFGFAPAISTRLNHGVWFRDPVLHRTMAVPVRTLTLLGAHVLTGFLWLAVVTVQAISICVGKPGGPARLLHRSVGRASQPIAYAFFGSAIALVGYGMWGGGRDQGFNTWWVRWIEVGCAVLSMQMYASGINAAQLCTREPWDRALYVSQHRDCMLLAIFFAAVPTGAPRLIRDIAQARLGPPPACNLSASPDLFFLSAAACCMVGLPLTFAAVQRFAEYRTWVVLYWVIIGASVVFLRPDLGGSCTPSAS